LPTDLEFKSFAKANENGSELLLHSSDHPRIDFTATEGGTCIDKYLKHYVAVYDPVTGQLDIAEAKKMTVRGTVRQAEPAEEDETPFQPTSNYSSRNALTNIFGTKKSKKLVQSRAENVLYSRGEDPDAANPFADALLSSMPEAEAESTTSDGRVLDTAAAIQAAKPLPTPDLTATDVSQAYPLSNLVFPTPWSSTLTAMPTSEWRTLVSEGKSVDTRSRYVALRLAPITQAANAHPTPDSPQTTTLQLLRYILLLVEFAHALRRFGSGGQRFLPISKWPSGWLTDHSHIPSPLLNALMKKYWPTGGARPTSFDLTLLQTTILALTLHIPPPSGHHGPGVVVTDPTDIQLDLSLEAKDARKYFRELGCRVEAATDEELSTWGIRRRSDQAARMMFAKLRVPLKFPQVRRGPPSGRR
jgi:DNA-directed RNA polymerase I subunit RPA49